ncbi:SNF2 domain-containing protein [Ruminiclostridium sufflavum DSM 19573]|uniref:SNF2 domain-containing protein n=1 Tax=Ruminiclostridium sufflavum DSM 19573 TaxID=1121337 RepID=A0A318XGC1_9FIRM|nr:phospholipase D-like domain-containing anti-phage protein [Ruminiclostridium sufflavum]PYG84911.1 SNF2 domain-containing protein [Ruminiclostridium sufflavum DSM 19573]
MINRYSSRRESLTDSLLKKKLIDAQSYDRIAGYFRSSIFEVAGEELENISGQIRVICNSDLSVEDVATAKMAQSAIRKEWCEYKPEELPNPGRRFEKLYNLLSSGKMEVKVLPNERFGLIHGKAGVITLSDGSRTSFLGSVNESEMAWKLNYELMWEDSSPEGVNWVQDEFNALWTDKTAIPLADFVIEDIKRIANRTVIDDVISWREEDNATSSVAVELPVFREQLGLWEHQKYFVDLAFREHKQSYGARFILADQVGLGKTIQLAMSAQLMALYGDKPVLIIVPKTLIWQWQGELDTLLDLPCAVWNGKEWVDENGLKYPNRGNQDISKCPRRIGILSQGLIVSQSPIIEHLLNKEYECIIVDEAHRARRQNFGNGKEYHSPEMNNLYKFLMQISTRTKSILLATATPIQLYPVELWDLMNILSQKNDSVLGSKSALWRKPERVPQGLDLIMGKVTKEFFDLENWDWIRNPFPPKYEDATFASVRSSNNMNDDDFVLSKGYVELLPKERQRIGNMLTKKFFANFNPYIRHVIRRERKYLEDTIDPNTNEPFLKKIEVILHGEDDDEALTLTGYLKQAYEYAEEFCNEIGKRSKSSGFLKTLLLKRIGSSIEAGKNTGYKMLNEWNTGLSDLTDEEDEVRIDSDIKNLTEVESLLLNNYVKALESNEARDPKYDKTVELLKDEKWLDKGVIIFSQYFDTARWVAEGLSKEFNDEPIGLYAGGSKSGVYLSGSFKKKEKEEIKHAVKTRDIKVLVGTDSASEGLNLQTLGNLINIDLPWNPTRLEQRKGRIQRIGQLNDTVHIYNMRYKDSVEDRVHHLLSSRLESIYSVFGQLPDVLEDVWIEIAVGDKAKALEIIDSVPKVHPFENRYNMGVEHIDWETCSRVLDKKEKRKYFEQSWK